MTTDIPEKRRVVMPWLRKRARKPKEALEEEQAVGSVNDQVAPQSASPNPVLESTIAETEQIATSIKMTAQQEAETEAERIINQAKQAAQKIKRKAEVAPQKDAEAKAEGIISQAKKDAEAKAEGIISQAKQDAEAKAEGIISQAKQDAEAKAEGIISQAKQDAEAKAEKIISQAKQEAEAKAEKIISQAKQEAEIKAEKPEEPAQPKKAATEKKIEEPVQLKEEAIEEKVEEPAQPKQDSHKLYAGEVELAIAKPVDPKMVSKLYNYLQTTPEIKLVQASGSWERGTTITVVLDKPIPLISAISSKIPEAEAKPERPERDGFVKGKRGVRRITIALKER